MKSCRQINDTSRQAACTLHRFLGCASNLSTGLSSWLLTLDRGSRGCRITFENVRTCEGWRWLRESVKIRAREQLSVRGRWLLDKFCVRTTFFCLKLNVKLDFLSGISLIHSRNNWSFCIWVDFPLQTLQELHHVSFMNRWHTAHNTWRLTLTDSAIYLNKTNCAKIICFVSSLPLWQCFLLHFYKPTPPH